MECFFFFVNGYSRPGLCLCPKRKPLPFSVTVRTEVDTPPLLKRTPVFQPFHKAPNHAADQL